MKRIYKMSNNCNCETFDYCGSEEDLKQTSLRYTGQTEICLCWDQDECETWGSTIFTWSDCVLVEEIIPTEPPFGGSGIAEPHPWPMWATGSLNKLNKEEKRKRKRLITLVVYVKEHRIVDEKEIKEGITVTLDDVYLVKEAMNKTLKVNVKNSKIL